jgi:tRNA threonylcarbamoyladenosine modification (KEOPS) complex  Pcc1 subunit
MVASAVYSAELRIPKLKGLVYKRLIGKIVMYKRSKVSLREDKNFMYVAITADDVTALRASANSIMRDVQIIEKAAKI